MIELTREEAIDELMSLNDSADIRELLYHGFKGYSEYTNKELLQLLGPKYKIKSEPKSQCFGNYKIDCEQSKCKHIAECWAIWQEVNK